MFSIYDSRCTGKFPNMLSLKDDNLDLDKTIVEGEKTSFTKKIDFQFTIDLDTTCKFRY